MIGLAMIVFGVLLAVWSMHWQVMQRLNRIEDLAVLAIDKLDGEAAPGSYAFLAKHGRSDGNEFKPRPPKEGEDYEPGQHG